MALSDRYKTAVVTGAGSGLGAAFVRMLLAEGLVVWGTSRNPSRLEPRERFHPVELELTDAASISRGWEAMETASGGVDLLVNNAGEGAFGPFLETEAEAWDRQIALLVSGPVRLCRYAARAMVARRRGCIVNVASLAVDFPLPYMSSYNAGKAALSGFSEALLGELQGTGVAVVDLRPGDYKTGFNEAMRVDSSAFDRESGEAVAWRRMEEMMEDSPDADQAAGVLRDVLRSGRVGTIRCGRLFQRAIAPLLKRIGPSGIVRRSHHRYFGLR